MLPWSVDLKNILMLLQKASDLLPSWQISSQLPVWVFILLVIMILEYGQIGRKRYLLAAVLLLIVNNFKSAFLPFYTVTFLDVGQGDSCIITAPFSSSALMIDTGGSSYRDLAKEVLIPYLQRNALRKVKVIVSHDDDDHCGALESLAENYDVDAVIREKKEKITFGNLTVHDPLYDLRFSNDNDNSLICYINISRFGFLFLGDVSSSAEEILAERYPLMDVDFIKLAHHGSSGSTSDRLLSTYLPEWGIISAGVNNSYGHPAREVLERLSAYKVSALNTQNEGAIRFTVFRWFAVYRTSEGKTGLIL
ncbi:MAG: MBL fold metallo-hydrolase [Erysipelotrichaceae bacterium]|nr:MBL fold metallo-hydrolase [Erysipelotrichaceae bacterium]